jgi:hypothetical protein
MLVYEFHTLIAVHEWAWDDSVLTPASQVFLEGQEVCFHPSYSSGTAAVRGSKPCFGGNVYYWEIKVLTPLFGTDVVSNRILCVVVKLPLYQWSVTMPRASECMSGLWEAWQG